MAIFAYILLKEPIHKKDILSFLIILSGMVLFFFESLKGGNALGNSLAILSGVAFGLMSVFLKMEKENDPIQGVFWGNLLAFCIALPFMGKLEWTLFNSLSVLFLGIFQLGISSILYSKAIHIYILIYACKDIR